MGWTPPESQWTHMVAPPKIVFSLSKLTIVNDFCTFYEEKQLGPPCFTGGVRPRTAQM